MLFFRFLFVSGFNEDGGCMMRFDMDGQNKLFILKNDMSSPQGVAVGTIKK